MQRLKQHNEGAVLPFEESELLFARASQTLPGRGWCVVRMRIEVSGEAERSVHYHGGRDHTAYFHEWVLLPENAVADVVAAVRSAIRERAGVPEREEDPQALCRSIRLRDGNPPPTALVVEYESEKAIGPAVAFESAWRLLSSQFPSTHAVREAISGLAW